MKCIIFSDGHMHQFTEFASVNADGVNSRLADALSIIDQIKDYAVENNIANVLFGGDLFHTRPAVNTLTFNLTITKLIELSRVCNLWILPGNHDCYSKDSKYHSLEVLKNIDNIHIFDGVDNATIDGTVVHAVPHDDNLKNIKDNIKSVIKTKTDDQPNILLLHAEIKGSYTPAGYRFDEGLGSKWLSKHFDWVFCGHIHKYQKFATNVFNVGSTHHHDWGDKWSQKGFVVLDTDTKKVEFVKTKYPEFREIDEIDITIYAGDTYNFYKINFDDLIDEDTILKVKEKLPNSIINCDIRPTVTKRSDLSLSMDWKDIIRTYVDSTTTGLNKKLLMETGLKLLKEVNE